MSPLFWNKAHTWDNSQENDQWHHEVVISQSLSRDDEEIGQLSLDVLESKESLYILAPLAGIKLEDIDISIHENTLIISWSRNKPKEFFDYGIEIKNEECFWGKFSRKILLPENIDFSHVKAVMELGLLVISLPKIRFSWRHIQIETPNL